MKSLPTTRRLLHMGSRNLARNRARSWITVVGLAVGLALASASWVLIDGYLAGSVNAMVGSSTGHFQIAARGQVEEPNLFDVVPDPTERMTQVEAVPGVLAVAPRVSSAVLLANGDRSAGAMLEGLSPRREAAVSDRPRQVETGRSADKDGEAVLGVDLADRLGAGLGDEVLAVSQAADGSIANALWRVVGLARTGDSARDSSLVWTTTEAARQFLVLDGVHTLIGVVSDPDGVESVVRAIAEAPDISLVVADLPTTVGPEEPDPGRPPEGADGPLPAHLQVLDPSAPLVVRSWRTLNPFMAQMFELGRSWTLIGVLLVLVTAGLGATNTMAMSVAERTRELGILIAVGMRPRHMIALVLFESLTLWVRSLALGLVLAAAACTWLVQVGIDFSQSSGDLVFGGVTIEPVIRGVWSAEALWVPSAMLLVVSVAASLVPAWRAARLDPVEAMRR